MQARIRCAVSLALLAALPLACAGKSVEAGDPMGTGSPGGSAGTPGTGTAGTAGQPSTTNPPTRTPVNRFPCTTPVPVPGSTNLESCDGGAYNHRTGGAVTCELSCADDCGFQCLTDNACPSGEGCDCAGQGFPSDVCVTLGCKSDSDCAPGFNCASYSDGCATSGYACQLPTDECASNADCDNSKSFVCVYTVSGRQCQIGGCLL